MPSSRSLGIRRLETLWQRAREPVFWLDTEQRLVFVNRAWEALTGYPAERVLGLVCGPPDLASPDELASLVGSFCPPPEALAGAPAGGLSRIVPAEGEPLWRRVEFWPYHDAKDGGLLGLFGCVRDPEASPQAAESPSQQLRAALIERRVRLRQRHGFDTLIGLGPSHRRLLDQVRAAAATAVPVLIQGEPGTGKRLVGRTIHYQSARHQAPLIPLDCAALPPEVLRREVFGDGATDAPFSASATGTAVPAGASLLIGDILDLPRDLQALLVARLETANLRLLATTAGDPDQALAADRLRSDLYFLLTTLVIRLRPLRERLEELPLLAQHLLERANQRGGHRRYGFSPEAINVLLGYDWPGNLRELARVIDLAQARGTTPLIQASDLPADIQGHLGAAYTPPPIPPPLTPLDQTLTTLERRLIERALERARQNKSRAAELLAISRPRLYRRMKELNIPDVPEPSGDGPPSSSAHRPPPRLPEASTSSESAAAD